MLLHSYQLVCWLQESRHFLRSWRFYGLETSFLLPTDPHRGWSPDQWSTGQKQQSREMFMSVLLTLFMKPPFSLLCICLHAHDCFFKPQYDHNNKWQPCRSIPCLITDIKGTFDRIHIMSEYNTYSDCYTYMGILLCGAYLDLSLCNLSLADSEIRYYTSMNKKQAGKMYTWSIWWRYAWRAICYTCVLSLLLNQDLARGIQKDKLQADETMSGVWA